MTQLEKMTKSSVPSLILKLSLPTIASMLISSLYNLADTYFVSQLGDSPSAAISVVFSVMTLIQAIAFTVGVGSGSMISRCLGSADSKEANKHASQAVVIALTLGLLVVILGLSFRDGLISALGATDSAKPFAKEYAMWIIIGCPFLMISIVLNNILRSEGKAVLSMIGISSGGLLNIALDPLLINVANLGVRGAGMATMIGQIVSFCILAIFFLSGKSVTRIHPKYLSKDLHSYLDAFKCGVPTLFRQGFSTSSNIILSFLAKPYGDPVVAALGITAKIYIVCRNIVIGFGQGYQPFLGYNYGAKRFDRIKRGFFFTLMMQTGFCLIATLIVVIFPTQLITLFRDSEEVIKVGQLSIRFLAISLPFLGFSTIVNQSLQVMGYSKSATFLASCRQGIVYTPLVFLLESLWSSTGLCLAQPTSDFITMLISIPFCIYLFRIFKQPSSFDDEKK